MGAAPSAGVVGAEPTAAVEEVALPDGARLPCEALGDAGAPRLVWGHGLGVPSPWTKGRRSCESFPVVSAALEDTAREASGQPLSLVVYDARGHGVSTGWEPADHNRDHVNQQFHWRSLAVDMLFVADRHRRDGVRALLGGYSMGASSALWAAFLCPTAVRGLVLLCVTTAWEIRAARRGKLLELASKLESGDHPSSACVVRGAAYADLPPLDSLRQAELRVPTLLAAARDDKTHPAEVVERLAEVLPNARLVVVDTTEELHRAFPGVLREWLGQLPPR